ncbi:sensor histidine kinase [Inquilinus sp. CA228]|uniref:sensor histidine kinase n=1 Tax=Inquilinus sp. CA228 TaxID=3455609 RepID=UPI003F8CFAAE
MNRFWAKSLAAQIIWFMLPILLLAQSIGFLVTADDRAAELREIALDEFVVRSATAAQLVDTTPSAYQDTLLNAMATNYSRFWLSPDGPGDLEAWSRDAWHRLHLPLRQGTSATPDAPSGPWGSGDGSDNEWGTTGSPVLESTNRTKDADWQPIELDSLDRPTPAQIVHLDDNYGAGLVARLSDGLWLNAAYAKPPKKFIWTSPSTVSLAITAIMLSALAVLVARRIARPIRRLTAAVESLGRGEQNGRIPEEGPDDIRRTAIAFNQMRERLTRFLADRTTMLAAIGHDLRTPITTMRLRTEFIADTEVRARLLDTVNEMQAITDATLELTQEQSVDEPTRPVDVAALVESICEDLADLGRDVHFAESGVIPYRCRPEALRRATRNLIENALRYGDRAQVSVTSSPAGVDIAIEDNGPGIPDKEIERVFLPFVRLEASRNVRTGGIGLGLSIARTVARAHGGDVILSNVPHGLRAVIHLPPIPGEFAKTEASDAA